jgi:HSP20 family protein
MVGLLVASGMQLPFRQKARLRVRIAGMRVIPLVSVTYSQSNPGQWSGTAFDKRLCVVSFYIENPYKQRRFIMALPTRVSRSLDFPFEHVQREFDQAIGRLFRSDLGYGVAPYGVDIREDADHIYVDAELPGFTKDQVDITLENNTLTITAQRKDETQEQNKGQWLLNERRFATVSRSFTLPPTVDESKCEAKLQDGVLHITLNKREETKPRKVKVS